MKKIIAWENWNEIETELMDLEDLQSVLEEEGDNSEEQMPLMPLPMEILSTINPIIQTPFGSVHMDSKLKPSDRWDCWLGYTNFGITEDIENKIKKIEGVDALKVMSRYTFCVGIAKLFKFSKVREDIENEICGNGTKIQKRNRK